MEIKIYLGDDGFVNIMRNTMTQNQKHWTANLKAIGQVHISTSLFKQEIHLKIRQIVLLRRLECVRHWCVNHMQKRGWEETLWLLCKEVDNVVDDTRGDIREITEFFTDICDEGFTFGHLITEREPEGHTYCNTRTKKRILSMFLNMAYLIQAELADSAMDEEDE